MSAGNKLARALATMAEAVGCAVCVRPLSERPWASATFVGALHVLTIAEPGSAGFDVWLDTLGDAEFAVPGHVVADVSVARYAGGARVSVLTLMAA